MKKILAIVILQHLQVAIGQNCVVEYEILPHLESRVLNNTNLANETFVIDLRLDYKWYNVGKRNIPDDHESLDIGMCGTYYPVWMNGTVPDETDGVVVRTACILSFNDYCAYRRTIEVRNCGTHMIYKLEPTTENSAYCFEPDLSVYSEASKGSICSQKDDCPDENAVFDNGTYICGSGYYNSIVDGALGGTCLPNVGLGTSCIQPDACSYINAKCDSGKCICDYGYYNNDNKSGYSEYGDTYDDCDNTGVKIACGICIPQVEIGFSFIKPDDCYDLNATCDNVKCICISGYYDNNGVIISGGICLAKVELGSRCLKTDACSDTNAVCDSVTCICGSGFYDDNGINTKGGTCRPSYPTDKLPLLPCEGNTDSMGTAWNFTYGNVSVTESCPPGFVGNVTRVCSASGSWDKPDYGDCVNKMFILLNNEFEVLRNDSSVTVINVSKVVSELNKATDPREVELHKAEIEIVVSLLNKVVGINTSGDIIGSFRLYENFLETASNVLDAKNKDAWQDLISNKNLGAELVLKSVEGFVHRISEHVNKDKRNSNLTSFQSKSIDVEIGYKFPLEFPRIKTNSSQGTRDFNTGFVLPILEDNNYTYAAVYYKNMSAILQKRIIQHGKLVDMRLDIGPEVLSLQLTPNPVKLPKPIQLMFKTFDTNFTNPSCSYWKFNASSDGDGAWSNDGCYVVSSNSNGTVCECDHLTNFAILMAPSEVIDPEHTLSLSIISAVGCSVSLICLMLTLLGHFRIWRHVKSRRICILMNICLALFLSYTTFLLGVNRTENKVVCIVITALLHYFFLTVFFLMLVQGIWIAVSVLYVFPTRSYLHWLLPLGWLIPMIIVGASLGITRLDGYGNEGFCWLSVKDGIIWAFAGPASLVIFINVIIIGITIRKMLSTSTQLTKTKQERARASVRALVVLLPITGVTWILGIFSVNDDLLVFQYLFCIFNSFQGLFVFLFHCVGNKTVRKTIKIKYGKQKALDANRRNPITESSNEFQEMNPTGGSGTKQ